jgi:hypothetical protein
MTLRFIPAILAPFVVSVLSQCVVVEPGSNNPGTATQLPGSAPSYGQPLTAETGTGSLTIRQGSRVLTSIRTASPNVEQTRWRDEQNRIVVKSRGNHGPATVQLFDARNGSELGRVMAYEIRGGQPAWAADMGE